VPGDDLTPRGTATRRSATAPCGRSAATPAVSSTPSATSSPSPAWPPERHPGARPRARAGRARGLRL